MSVVINLATIYAFTGWTCLPSVFYTCVYFRLCCVDGRFVTYFGNLRVRLKDPCCVKNFGNARAMETLLRRSLPSININFRAHTFSGL